MQSLKQIFRVILCTLLFVGYGGMYAGSILHDLGHDFGHLEHHDSEDVAAIDIVDGKHVDVTCFFCSHSQVLSDEVIVPQTWTPNAASLAPPVDLVSSPHSQSLFLSYLRGPPVV